jgi:hypothetical protein
MLSRIQGRLTYANVIATLALFIAIGGSSYAAVAIAGRDDVHRSLSGRDMVRESKRGNPADVNVPPAGATQKNAVTFSFGGKRRVAIGQQPIDDPKCCYVPGAGIVQVNSGTGRTARLTHYAYGSTIQTTGPKSNLFEFFLGSAGTGQPQLSVRSNGTSSGASIQARNVGDTSGIVIDYAWPLRPRLTLENDNNVPGAVLGIENPQPGGKIAFATKTGGQMHDHMTLDDSGALSTDNDVAFGDRASDKVRFHGSKGSGAQGTDPGALSTSLTAADVDSPAGIAARLNEERAAINLLRAALLQQGLIG